MQIFEVSNLLYVNKCPDNRKWAVNCLEMNVYGLYYIKYWILYKIDEPGLMIIILEWIFSPHWALVMCWLAW